jgi:hypothetical protein
VSDFELRNIKIVVDSSYFDKIEDYRSNFRVRANGYELPLIEYVGSVLFVPKIFENSNLGMHISIPVKNQESILTHVLESLFASLSMPTTVSIIFDNCDDYSLEIALTFIDCIVEPNNHLKMIHLVKSSGELFESTCDNISFLFCEKPYFLTLQADIFLNDFNFQSRAVSAFNKHPELFAISGRAVVPLESTDQATSSRSISRVFLNSLLRFLLKSRSNR